MPRSSHIIAALRLAALLILLLVFATSSAEAKQKSNVAEKGPGYAATKHKSSIAAKRKAAKRDATKRKRSVAAKQVPVTATPRTPLNKGDCIEMAQALYERAQALSRRKDQTIPQEFELVVSKLDEFCGEEEFGKARISIDWMHSCLQKFTKDFCSRDKSYFCAIDPESEKCLSQNSETQGKSPDSR
jgi:hypothetical protein